MKTILKLEEAGKFLLSYVLTLQLGFAWWTFFAWLLVPDISMIGYAVNARVGALLYNIVHHQGVAIAVWMIGILLNEPYLQFAGILLFGHSAMDRMLGYGLKYSDSFQNTHLGMIGKKSRLPDQV